jgi:vitamin B12/bleomycin/antimicrobial peptide transport system ATP-binding/permease protein
VPLDGELRSALVTLDAFDLVARAEGADRELDWERLLPLHDQHALELARILVARPRFAFIDNLGQAVGVERLPKVFAAFAERGITCVAFGDHEEPRGSYHTVLVLAADGTWSVEVLTPLGGVE